MYLLALKSALQETGLKARSKEFAIPKECPYSLRDLLEGDLDKLQPRPPQ